MVSDIKSQQRAIHLSPLLICFWTLTAILLGLIYAVEMPDQSNKKTVIASIAVALAFTGASIQRRLVRRAKNAELEATLRLHQINSMLQSIDLGIFTLNERMEIEGIYSKFLETILDEPKLSNLQLKETILDRTDLNSENKQGIITSLRNSLGEDLINFELNSHLLPKQATLHIHGAQKIVDFTFAPVVVDHKVTKIVIVLKDCTQIEQLKKTSEEQNLELKKVFRILKVPKDDFTTFTSSATRFIQRSRSILMSSDPISTEQLAELFRNLHTLKGNARALGFDDLSSMVHRAEDIYDRKRLETEFAFSGDELLPQLAQISGCFDAYTKLFREKISAYGGEKQKPTLPDLNMLLTAREVFQIEAQNRQPDIQNKISTVAKFFESMYSESFASLIQHIIEDIPRLAKKLNKPAPLVTIIEKDVLVPMEFQDIIKDVVMHLMRNSIDHGIESSKMRALHGKPEQGNILIKCHDGDGFITFEFRDDGQGLDFEKILAKGIKMGILRPGDRQNIPKVLECIFVSSLTTKDSVTEISGRGVGLDIVRGFIEEKSGSVRLQVEPAESDSFFPFSIKIEIPKVQKLVTEQKNVLTGIKIVIIEDDFDQLERLEEFFLSSDIKADCFSSPKEALNFIMNNEVDVIISDMVMPEMDGKELLFQIKNKNKMPQMFIFLTGYFDISQNELTKEGVSIIFSKPVSPITIINHIKNSYSVSRKKM